MKLTPKLEQNYAIYSHALRPARTTERGAATSRRGAKKARSCESEDEQGQRELEGTRIMSNGTAIRYEDADS